MCPILAAVLLVNRLLFFFFCCSHLQNYRSKQGRWYALLSSLYYLDIYARQAGRANEQGFSNFAIFHYIKVTNISGTSASICWKKTGYWLIPNSIIFQPVGWSGCETTERRCQKRRCRRRRPPSFDVIKPFFLVADFPGKWHASKA